MSGPFKLKYKNSAFPFKEDDKKKSETKSYKPQPKEISDDIGYDEEYDIFYDKDIQKSFERGTGKFAPPDEGVREKIQQNIDREV